MTGFAEFLLAVISSATLELPAMLRFYATYWRYRVSREDRPSSTLP